MRTEPSDAAGSRYGSPFEGNAASRDGYLLGIDLGTQGTKTVLYDLNGNAMVSSFEASELLTPADGAVEQRADDIYRSVLTTVKDVMERSHVRPGAVEAIGMDGQMAGILGIDRDFRAVTPLDSWLDTRCEPYIRQMKETAEEPIIRLTGCPVTYAHGPKILRWKTEYPDRYREIAKFVEPVTYVVGRLCGLSSDQAYLDYTNLHFSGFADNQRLCWSDDLCRLFGVDRGKLPDIVDPCRVVGRLTADASQAMGLMAGIPIVAGCGDQAATSLGVGVARVGDCFDGAGTASVFACVTDRYCPDLAHKTILFPRHVVKGLFQPMAYISGGGLCLKWLKSTVLEDAKSYRELEAEAESIAPGNGGLYFIPHFQGRTCPNDPAVKGMFYGLSFSHNSAALFRAVLDAVACEYKLYLDILKENGTLDRLSVLYGTGGGSVSSCFNQIKADVLNVAYGVTARNDTAPFGAALLAGCGVGIYPDPATAAGMFSSLSAVYRPDPEKHRLYLPYAARYAELLGQCGSLLGEKADASLVSEG